MFAQIERERNALIATFFEQRPSEQHRHAAAILPEHLGLKGLYTPGLEYCSQGVFNAVAPIRRCHILPAHPARGDIFMIVLQHAQKGFVGRKDGAFDVPGCDSQNIGVDQPPDLRFTVLDLMIEAAGLGQSFLARAQPLAFEFRLVSQSFFSFRSFSAKIGHFDVRRHACQQLPRRKRLDEIIVRACRQPFHLGLFASPCRQQQHRDITQFSVFSNCCE